jgi:acetyltransferase
MNTHKLDRIFKPQRIALYGVTENPKSVAGTVLRNVVGSGFRGAVYPINPSCEAVLGVHCFPDLAQLPRTPDLAVICSPAPQVPAIVRECGEAGVRGLIIISAGFREAGAEGRALEEQVRAEAACFEGMRILGPNCLGVMVPAQNLNLTFAGVASRPGRVAFVSQSGALCTSVLDWAVEAHVGFSYFVSVGNMLDVDFADLIDYFGEDESTDSIILYVESLREARRFMTAARAFARSKPIVAYKAGRFPESEKAAASHTGALASEDAVYEAAFQRAGIARVFEIGDIFNCVELVGRQKRPGGPRLGIITNAGGPGVMATDALMARQGVMAELSAETVAALDEALPPAWSHGNPVDVLGDARSKRYAKALQILVADAGVDAVLAILTPQAMTNPSATAREVAAIAERTHKPILAAWLGGKSMREGIEILTAAGIATYPTPEDGVKAFMTLCAYSRNLEILYETPKDVPVTFALDRAELRRTLGPLLAEERTLSEAATKQLLEAYGIPGTRPQSATSAEEAVQLARQVGYPVVLKVLSPEISHKSDVGGVALDLRDDGAVRIAYEGILGMARQRQPGARLAGVTVQPMIQASGATEMILGTKRDPVFGSVILVGLGGVMAEVYRDRALGLPPLNERLARRMLESLRSWPLLRGFRGRAPVNLDRLVELMIRFSYLVADYPEIVELDVNPLLVSSRDALALDARAVVAPAAKDARPYAHLALCPYPEEQVRRVTLRDGTALMLRPIRPEDEPRWKALLASCSPEALYARFRYLFQWSTHEAATRYCFIDYDREIAIVAESDDGNGERSLLGVGRLISDPDLDTGEYAVLVTDAYQNRGLGSVLTDTCLEIARSWGLRRVVAQTTSDNARMIAVFAERGFEITPEEEGLVTVSKLLG